MKGNKDVKISYVAAHLTTIITVSLVLVLVGIIAMIWTGAVRETQKLREKIELSVVMADSVPNENAMALAEQIRKQPYALSVTYISKEQALKNWTRDTGEDLGELFGVNPLSPEVSFTVKADYSTAVNIEMIKKSLAEVPGVEDVSSPDARMVEEIHSSISGVTALLGIIAIVMIVISFVLINNTVHLTIYSRRFTIHTMQLVGATDGYIRRPIVMNNIACGLIAGIIASGLLALALVFAPAAGFDDMEQYVSWVDFAIIAGGVTLIGMLICALASWIATARYMKKDYDELFR